jgi:glycerol-3-phosphate dehydrogenase
MIARRLRLAFLNVQAAQEALPDIINIMGEELEWSEGSHWNSYRPDVKISRFQMKRRSNTSKRLSFCRMKWVKT